MIGPLPPAKNAAGAKGRDQRRQVTALCLGLAAITFAVFGQTLDHEFVDFDDDLYVYDNPMVAQGLTRNGIVWAFTHAHSANWHPLTWLSHMLDCQLYGLHPGGHHLTSVLLHTATVVALFLVLRQMTGALWRSAFVAAVFAIHPLRVESVAWVAERKDVLSGLFFMLTIAAYVGYARRPGSWGRYALVLLLFAMGLLAKPMLVTLPLVLLLLDYWPLRRKEPATRLALEKLPLLALSAASCVVTLWAQHQGNAIHSGGSFSLSARSANAVTACMVYLGRMVYPAGLAVLYPFPRNGTPAWELALAVIMLAGCSALAWNARRAQPWLLMGWIWYLVMLLPVLGLIQVGRQAHADRYTYLPQIGIYVAATWLVAGWRISRAAYWGLATGVLAVLMACAWKQTAYWQDSVTLWTRALACAADSDMTQNNLGNALLRRGRVDEAITHFQSALQMNPDYPEARNNLGSALARKGRVDEAIAQDQAALQIMPDFPEARYNLAGALLQKGQFDQAIVNYEEALRLRPGLVDAHNGLGNALAQKGRVDEAIAQFQEVLESMPRNPSIHVNLANAFLQKGREDEAMAEFQSALEIEPVDMEVQNNLAWLLATCGEASLRNGERAVQLARQANQMSGGKNPVILGTLAAALAETGKFDEAARSARAAVALAQAAGKPKTARRLSDQLQLYEAARPFHRP